MFRRSAIFFVLGIAILFASVSLNRLLGPERSVTANVFAEGLTIAAWVSLWEALAIILIEWFPPSQEYRAVSAYGACGTDLPVGGRRGPESK